MDIMNYNVPALSIAFMVLAALFGIAIPVVLCLVFRKKHKADIVPVFYRLRRLYCICTHD